MIDFGGKIKFGFHFFKISSRETVILSRDLQGSLESGVKKGAVLAFTFNILKKEFFQSQSQRLNFPFNIIIFTKIIPETFEINFFAGKN